MEISQATDASAETAAVIVNGGFEETSPNGEIPGWKPHGTASQDAFTVSDAEAFEGDQSLHVTDQNAEGGVRLDGDRFEVTGGVGYVVDAAFLVESYESPGAPTWYLYFYDAAGEQVAYESGSVGQLPTGDWQRSTMAATAPAEATHASLMMYSSVANRSAYYVDDIRVGPAAAPAEYEEVGSLYAANVRLAAMDVQPDGTPVVYAFSDGNPVTFNVIDARSGDLIDSVDFPGYTVASSVVVDDDGTVYLSVRAPNDGTLWRYVPGTKTLDQLATGVVGEAMLRTLLIHDGTLYGTTYPEAKVYSYGIGDPADPGSGDIRDYGSVVDDGDYAWGFDEVEGRLWVGTGAVPRLMSLDPATGAVEEVGLPPEASSASFVNRITRHGDLVFVNYSPASPDNVVVYDLTADEWCVACADALGGPVGFGHFTQGAIGERFFFASGGTVQGYDVDARQAVSIGWEDSALAGALGTTRTFEPMQLGTPEFPGDTLVGVRGDGSIWRYNLSSGAADILPNVIESAPATIHSVGQGPEGNLYFGTYLSPGVMGRIDHRTGELEQLSGPVQADSITAHDDAIVVGVYPNAEYHVGEVTDGAVWNWGTNPHHLFTLGRAENGQDRPLNTVSAGDVVAGGTIPNYGELGGGLVFFDPGTGEHEFHRNVVQDQSVTALAYADGVLFGGTSIHGGLSSEPTQAEAELFLWDMEAGARTWSGVVVPGATIINALMTDPDGTVWGMADDGTVFEFDPETRAVTRTIDTGLAERNSWGRRSDLHFRESDGHVYGNAAGALFRFDPESLEFEVLVDGDVREFGIDASDTLYFADATSIFRVVDELACDVTVTGAHRGPLVVGDGTACLDAADVSGPLEVRPGAAVVVEDSRVAGAVSSDGAREVVISSSRLSGPVSISATTGSVVLSGNRIAGPLHCAGNAEQPTDAGAPNTVAGPATGQCAGL